MGSTSPLTPNIDPEDGQELVLLLRCSVQEENSEVKQFVDVTDSSTVIFKTIFGHRKGLSSGETILAPICWADIYKKRSQKHTQPQAHRPPSRNPHFDLRTPFALL